MTLAPIDRTIPYYAALSCLRAGGTPEAARVAAEASLGRPGWLDWLEAPIARAAFTDALENHTNERAANARLDQMRSAAE